MADFRDQINGLPDAIGEMIRSKLLDVHVALPAVVKEAFDATRCSVTVKPLLKRAIPAADGTYAEEDLPEIYDVPVAFPMWGGFQFTMPIAVGDVCLLVFPDYDPGAWRSSGQVTGPGDTRRHHLSGAVAIFGALRKLNAPLTSFNASAMEMGAASGLRVAVTSTQMQVGGSSDAAALASKVDALASAFSSLRSAFLTHVHGGVTTGTGSTSATATTSPAYSGGASASQVLKVGS